MANNKALLNSAVVSKDIKKKIQKDEAEAVAQANSTANSTTSSSSSVSNTSGSQRTSGSTGSAYSVVVPTQTGTGSVGTPVQRKTATTGTSAYTVVPTSTTSAGKTTTKTSSNTSPYIVVAPTAKTATTTPTTEMYGSNEKWWSGDTPTRSELEARAYTLYKDDDVALANAQTQIQGLYSTKGSPWYNPYTAATNSAYIDNLTALGVDTSNIDDDFYANNASYMPYLEMSDSGTPKAPTKKSSKEAQIAYYVYQLQKDENTTKEAESEWAEMRKEIAYWTNKGLSDDEILAKVNADGKYTTLKKMDSQAALGAPLTLNRAVGYSSDAQKGVIWATRTGASSGDDFSDSVYYALGEGKGYTYDKTKAEQRDITSPNYNPYSDGSTMDDVNMYFGRNTFDQQWLNDNKEILNGTDTTAQKNYMKVYKAEQTTQKAEQESADTYAWIDAKVAQGWTKQEIKDELQYMYDNPSSSNDVSMSTLKSMDTGRTTGDPISLTRSVNWKLSDAMSYIDNAFDGTTSAATGKANVAALASKNAQQTTSSTATTAANGTQEEAATRDASAGYTEEEYNNAVETKKNLESQLADAQDKLAKANSAWAQTTYQKEVDDLQAQIDNESSIIVSYEHSYAKGNFEINTVQAGNVASDTQTSEQADNAEENADDTTVSNTEKVTKSEESDENGAKSTENDAKSAENGTESAETVTPALSEEAKQQKIQERESYIQSYQDMQRQMETGFLGSTEMMEDTLQHINELTAEIGDGYKLTTAYTNDEARAVLNKALSGEQLTEQENTIFNSFYADYGLLLGSPNRNTEDSFREFDSASMKYGKTAGTALLYASANDATTAQYANTVMQIVSDSQSAEEAGVSLEEWYDQNPEAKERVLSVQTELQENRAAKQQAEEEQAEENKKELAKAGLQIAVKVSNGETLTEQEQQLYTQIQGIDADALRQTDTSLNEIDNHIVDMMIGGDASDASAEWQTKVAQAGITDTDSAMAATEYMRAVVASDAALAAASGMTLDELYTAYPQLRKTDDELLEMAVNHQIQLNTTGTDEESVAGVGFWKAAMLGIESGANAYVSDKVGALMAFHANAADGTTAADNYWSYVGEYGVADARYNYDIDIRNAINDMADDDPNKAVYQQMYDDAKANGTDLFAIPFNFGYEALKNVRKKYQDTILENQQFMLENGTESERFVYNQTTDITSNSLNMATNLVVSALTGSPMLGTAISFGTSELGSRFTNMLDQGYDVGTAKLTGVLCAAATTFLEYGTVGMYLSGDPTVDALKDSAKALTSQEVTKAGWRGMAQKTGRAVRGYVPVILATGLGEALQENVENVATGAIVAGTTGDTSELVDAFKPSTIIDTTISTMITSFAFMLEGGAVNLAKTGAGKVSNKISKALQSGKAKTQQTQTQEQTASVQQNQTEQQQVQGTQQQQTAQQGETQQTQWTDGQQVQAPSFEERVAQLNLTEQEQADLETYTELYQEEAAKESADAQSEQQSSDTRQETAREKALQEIVAQRQVNTFTETVSNSQVQNQLTEMRAAQLVTEQVGQGALNTETIQQAKQALTTAKEAQTAANERVTTSMTKLNQIAEQLKTATEQAGTKDGAKLIQKLSQQYASQNAVVQEARNAQTKANAQVQQAQKTLAANQRSQLATIRQQAQVQATSEIRQGVQTLQQKVEAKKAETTAKVQAMEERKANTAAESTQSTQRQTQAELMENYADGMAQMSEEGEALRSKYKDASQAALNAEMALDAAQQQYNELEAAGADQETLALAKKEISKAKRKVTNTTKVMESAELAFNNQMELEARNAYEAQNQNTVQQNAVEGTQQAQEQAQTEQVENPMQAQEATVQGQETAETGTVEGSTAEAGQQQTQTAEQKKQGSLAEVRVAELQELVDRFSTDKSGQEQQRQFDAETAQKTNLLSNETKAELLNDAGYISDSNKAQMQRAITEIENKGLAVVQNEWLNKDVTQMTNQADQTMGIALMALAAKQGNTAMEIAISEKYGEMGTEVGQSLQARAAYLKMSPTARKMALLAFAEQQQNAWNSKHKRKITLYVSEETMNKLSNAKNSAEFQQAYQEGMRELGLQMPSTLVEKINAWRYLSMLGNPRTQINNLAGNTTMKAEAAVKDKISALFQTIARATGQTDSQDRVLLTKKEYKEFAKTDLKSPEIKQWLSQGQKYLTDMQLGLNAFEDAKREHVFGESAVGKLLNEASNLTSKGLSMGDIIFKNGYYTNALAGYLQGHNINLSTITEEQLQEARKFAVKDAYVNTFNNVNQAIAALSKFENDLRSKDTVGSKVAVAAIEGVIPFKNTPANVLARGFDYSPAGLVNNLTNHIVQLKQGKITKNQFIDKVSAGLTGTGAFIMGAILQNLGIIQGSFGDNDDEADWMKLKGYQEYSINIGDWNLSGSWLSVPGMALYAGANYAQLSLENGMNFGTIIDSLTSMADPVVEMSMLQGINDLFDQDDVGGVITQATLGWLGQFIPTLSGQIARFIDPVRRNNYTDKNSSIPSDLQYWLNKQRNKIPFLSKTSTPYVDAWGEQDVSDNAVLRFVENFLSPAYFNKITEDDVTEMVDYMREKAGNTDMYPNVANKYIQVKGKRINLTAEQYAQYQTDMGQNTRTLYEGFLTNPTFAGLEPEYQAEAMELALTWSNKDAQLKIDEDVSIPTWMNGVDTIEEALNVIVDKAYNSQVSDHAENNANIVAQNAATYDASTLEENTYMIAEMRQLGLTDNEIQRYVTKVAKTNYKKAYLDGDTETCKNIEQSLMALQIGYKEKDFDSWARDARKSK